MFELVNKELWRLEGLLPAYACVSAEGLTDNGDHVHINAKSLREFGIRYAKTYLDLIAENKKSTSLRSDRSGF